MVRLEDYSQASKLAFSYIKPGVLTNHVMTADEYRADIEAGALFAYTWPGGLLFLRGRGGYHLLSYYLNDLSSLPDCELPGNTTIEIGYKPFGAGAAAQVIGFWERVGFRHKFERVRLTRPPGAADTPRLNRPFTIAPAAPIDAGACYELMKAGFDPITGHIPTLYEVEASIRDGCILCLNDSSGVICGLLRFISRAAFVEIRQMAVSEAMRGQGLANSLLNAFIEKCGDRKCTVWARDGYLPAIRAYNSAGFAADGWRSGVLTFGV